MEMFIVKLFVAVFPLVVAIALINLSDPKFRQGIRVVFRGRRCRTAMARALAGGVMIR